MGKRMTILPKKARIIKIDLGYISNLHLKLIGFLRRLGGIRIRGGGGKIVLSPRRLVGRKKGNWLLLKRVRRK
jgi:hypothetical protein